MHANPLQKSVFSNGADGGHAQATQPANQRSAQATGTPWWAVIAAIACAVGLLFAFQQVVLAGAKTAEARNQAATAHADALWRCYYQPAEQRERCQARLQNPRTMNDSLNSFASAEPDAENSLSH